MADEMLITVIGRGHSGTRAMSHTLSESGVYMGAKLNKSGDLVPAEDLYEACCVFGKYVRYRGGFDWDFSATHSMPIDPAFTRLVESYLGSVLASDDPLKGWKLPETTLILPWIVRLFPDIRYIYWLRDPRDCILGCHMTDDLARFEVPHEPTDDVRKQRIASWLYQYQIMQQTPPPTHRITVRFEEFVMDQWNTRQRLESFLGIPIAAIPVRPESIGRWRSDPCAEPSGTFPAEVLYDRTSETIVGTFASPEAANPSSPLSATPVQTGSDGPPREKTVGGIVTPEGSHVNVGKEAPAV